MDQEVLAHRVIPVLLQRGATLVKGTRFDSWRSIGHALQAVRVHNARGVDELVYLDIAATPENRGPDFDMVERLAADCFMPLTVGGGVRSVDDVRELLRRGADKVAICTNFGIIQECARRFGSQAIVACVDVVGGEVATQCGKWVYDESRAIDAAYTHELAGAGEILLTSIDRDGTLEGYDLELIRAVSSAVKIPVIANGGCGTPQHALEAIQAGASAVAAGAMYAWTDVTPRDVSRYLNEHNIEARV